MPCRRVPDPALMLLLFVVQREVLDVVDSSSSAIVVAPTSSGKTFISDYVCNHVMQHGGRVVFVAPTKALVNQQHAQVRIGSVCSLCVCRLVGQYVRLCTDQQPCWQAAAASSLAALHPVSQPLLSIQVLVAVACWCLRASQKCYVCLGSATVPVPSTCMQRQNPIC